MSKYILEFEKPLLKIEDREINRHILLKVNDSLKVNRDYKAIGWILDHRDLMNILINLDSEFSEYQRLYQLLTYKFFFYFFLLLFLNIW